MSSFTKALVGVKLSLLLALFSLPARADTDKAAHFGVAYAAQSLTYGFAKKAFRLNRTEALIFSAFTVLVVSTAKEVTDRKFDAGDVRANMLGIATASATVLIFDF